MSDFEIVPIPGREKIQQNFATLPQKAANYSGRKISLNERFSVIERGYYLRPVERSPSPERKQVKVLFYKDVDQQQNLADILQKKKAREEREQPCQLTLDDLMIDSVQDSSASSPTPTTTSDSCTDSP